MKLKDILMPIAIGLALPFFIGFFIFGVFAILDTEAFCASRGHDNQNRLSLSAQASTDIPQDVVRMVLFYEKQGDDPSALTQLLKQKTGQALNEVAHKNELHTGALAVYPATDRDGHVHGWRGRTELWLESTDFPAAAHLAGQLSSLMAIGNIRFSLSAQAEQHAKTKLAKEAIATFLNKATVATQAFGYKTYAVREITIHDSRIISPQPMMIMASHLSGTDLPIVAGKTEVAVSVSGKIQMYK